MAKVFLDAGHGGKDSGATGNGLQEKDINLELAKRTRSYLQSHYENVTVRLSRESDEFLELDERTDMANKWGADVFVSFHINATAGADGFESYIWNGNIDEHTAAFQNVLHRAITRRNDLDDRGQKRANFHVLRESHMEACLTENGFITNTADAKKMKDDKWLDQVAIGHGEGIAEFFGLKKREAESPIEEAAAGGVYRVQIGVFGKKENADALAAKAEEAGFNVYVYRD
jgi:N-acetylmuramoyl-L-alanine amidase